MFIGHFAVAFAAKKAAPSVSLGTLFVATQLADLVWPTLVLLGIEVVEVRPGITAFTPLEFVYYPYSHSLLALAGWGFALAVVYGLVRRPPSAALLALFALVISHWVLDVLSHRPDMPLTITGSERLGFDLWSSILATLIVETLMFAGGVALYCAATRPIDRTGKIALWTLVGFLFLVYLASSFGPPPPSAAAVAWSAQAVWLLVAWGYWVDRHRLPKEVDAERLRPHRFSEAAGS